MVERRLVSEVAQIYRLYQERASAVNEGDRERWIELWTDDAIQMPPGTHRRNGIPAIGGEMQPQRDAFQQRDMRIQIEEVQIQGIWAYCYGTFTATRSSTREGNTPRVAGKFLDILRKEDDGSWKFAINCHNYDT